MQDFNSPGQPPGAFGGPPPPAKKGLSKGCIIGIVVAVVLAGVTVVIIALGIGGVLWFSKSAREVARDGGATTPGTSRGSSSSSDEAEGPSPTAAQTAAVAGGQEVVWSQQEISWTVPQRWKQHSAESQSFIWRSPGTWDAASLIGTVSPMAADFPTEIALNAAYQQAQTRKQQGEVNEVRWLKIDGVKGVMFRESAPEKEDDSQRLQWLAYRTYKGQPQLVNIMLAARGKDFARHEDSLFGILYSTKLTK